MCKGKASRLPGKVLLLSLLIAGQAFAAVADQEELLVDPTAPLNLFRTTGDFQDVEQALLTGQVTYELGSILIRENDRVAVVNARRVRVGDSLGTARVRAIEPGSVTLEVDGREEILTIYKGSVKTLVDEGEG